MVKGKLFGSSPGKANKPKNEQSYKKILWFQCQCSGSSQIPSQDDLNYNQFLSLYKIAWINGRPELHMYDTENKKDEVKVLDTELDLSNYPSITQLPNGELFCYGNVKFGITLIIDRSYRVRVLPFGTPCVWSSALYFDNNIYCFGGYARNGAAIALSRKFDLRNNRWVNLIELPEDDWYCHSVIFNGNILISGHHNKNLWLYSIEVDSFSIIPYDFAKDGRKVLINVEKLYLIEWGHSGLIYEGKDEYHWDPISKSEVYFYADQMYCLYNKKSIYISTGMDYYQFDLEKKVLRHNKRDLRIIH